MEKLDNEDNKQNNKDNLNNDDLNKISNIEKQTEKEEVAEDESTDIKDEMKNFKEMNELLFNKKFKKGEQIKDIYKFWDTQPVTNFKEESSKLGPIDDKNDLDAVRKEPLALPKNFFWQDIDIKNKKELTQVKNLIDIKIFLIYILLAL